MIADGGHFIGVFGANGLRDGEDVGHLDYSLLKQMVFTDETNRARLRAFLPHLLDEANF